MIEFFKKGEKNDKLKLKKGRDVASDLDALVGIDLLNPSPRSSLSPSASVNDRHLFRLRRWLQSENCCRRCRSRPVHWVADYLSSGCLLGTQLPQISLSATHCSLKLSVVSLSKKYCLSTICILDRLSAVAYCCCVNISIQCKMAILKR